MTSVSTGGRPTDTTERETPVSDLDRIAGAAAVASAELARRGRAFRAELLRAMANALESEAKQIVAVADEETAIGPQRLTAELARTCFQLRSFADAALEGSYLEATIDPAGPTPMGPRPDLRRQLVPIGPVAVFGAGNFPLAFSVPGGDTASALAAGCAVVIKAHPGHPRTSELTFALLEGAARTVGAPDGTLAIVWGTTCAQALVAHPAIRAVAFTGSQRGGRALFDLASARPDPIPFYGELGSINPLVVTPAAAAARPDELAAGILDSATTAAGQLCTKPGLVLVPATEGGDRLAEALSAGFANANARVALNLGIAAAYEQRSAALCGHPDVAAIHRGAEEPGAVTPQLFVVAASDVDADLAEEVFGPATVLARYGDDDELHQVLRRLPGALTASVHFQPDEEPPPLELADLLAERVGRVIWNGYPTGVAVAWAMQHGGPWPSTTSSLHTSVGMTALRRFLRPITWQNAPADALPVELRDEYDAIPRRIDGRVVPAKDPG